MKRDVETVTKMPLSLNIKDYGLTEEDKEASEFVITPKKSGVVTILRDGKRSFVSNLKIDGEQEAIGGSTYRFRFAAQAGRSYRVILSKPYYRGLYSAWANVN
ncbi:MAG: hypothetical protein LBP89_09600 [Helicobacteraceae bacterium]|jgi:hypothetical protein|nr:hypothetical protein [Helicobacteraceae bacterium]